jgi:FKBP-type peptidyl-prolyl cis-trans isomerase (trigger factor)
MRSQGVDVSHWPEERQKDFVAQFGKSAERNVRMSMVVERIAETEGIRCEDADYEAHLEKMSKAVNQPVDVLKKYIDQHHQKAELEDQVTYEKALDFLIASAKVAAA